MKHVNIGKVHSRTGHQGPEGEQQYGTTLSFTSVLDGGRWSMPCPGCCTPRNDPVQGRSGRVHEISQ